MKELTGTDVQHVYCQLKCLVVRATRNVVSFYYHMSVCVCMCMCRDSGCLERKKERY